MSICRATHRHNTPVPQPTSRTLSPGWIARGRYETAHGGQVTGCAAPGFQAGDHSQRRPGQGHHAVPLAQCRADGVPLGWARAQGQQDQRRAGAGDLVKDAVDLPFLRRMGNRRSAVLRIDPTQEIQHWSGYIIAAFGSNVGVVVRVLVIGEGDRRGGRQAGYVAVDGLSGATAVGIEHQQSLAQG